MAPNTALKIDPFAVEPDEQEEVSLVVREAKALTMTCNDDLNRGKEFILAVKALKKKIKDHHAPIIKSAHETHKIAKGKENELINPLDQAERIVRNLCEDFLLLEKRRQREEQRRLDEVAQQETARKMEAAKTKIAAMASATKDEAGQIEQLKTALQDAKTTDIEAAVYRSQLSVLETSAETRAQVATEEQAQLEMGVMVAEPVPVVEKTKVEGVSESKTYTVEVTDLKALCAAIGRGEVPATAVKEVASKLKGFAKDGIKLPGCKVAEKVQASFR